MSESAYDGMEFDAQPTPDAKPVIDPHAVDDLFTRLFNRGASPRIAGCACCEGRGVLLIPSLHQESVEDVLAQRARAQPSTIFTHREYLCSCSAGEKVMEQWEAGRAELRQEAETLYADKRMNERHRSDAVEAYARRRLPPKPRRYEDVYRRKPPTEASVWNEKVKVADEINRRIEALPHLSNSGKVAETPLSNSGEKSPAPPPPEPLTNLPPAAKIDP